MRGDDISERAQETVIVLYLGGRQLSARRAWEGSIRAARRAGWYAASTAAPTTRATAAANGVASRSEMV
jgi:hypothetical protein